MTDQQIQRLGYLNKIVRETGMDSLLPAEQAEFNDLIDELREDIKQQSKGGKASNDAPARPKRLRLFDYVARKRRQAL